MKKILFVLELSLGLISTTLAYDFSAVAPTGQTLYYVINQNNISVSITYPGSSGSDLSNYWYGYSKPTGHLTIPSSVMNNGLTYSVTSIVGYAFAACTGLISISIPNSVSKIDQAFIECTGLTSVSIPKSISSFRFAFCGCKGLTSINILDSITFISEGAFQRCGFKSLNIPNHIDTIGDIAFYNCTELMEVTIPNSVTSIGPKTFWNCTGLTKITIPNSITSIYTSAFSGCTALKSITIPNSVTSIYGSAFRNCTGLTAISFEGRTPPVIGNDAFYGVPTNVPVYIPCGTLALYTARLPYLTNFIENTFTFSAVSADEQMGTVQVLNQPTCTNPNAVLNAIPNEGYKFDHWSTGSKMNPYNFTVTTDTVITAYFVSKGDGIVEAEKNAIRVFAYGDRIIVEGAEGKTICVYDIMGRLVGNHALHSGIYYVKVGNYATQKVAVFK